jgi:ribosomal protein S18 acetylase RimI-like enzyme
MDKPESSCAILSKLRLDDIKKVVNEAYPKDGPGRPPRYGGLESGKLGYILNLYTVPEARRNGICTRMLHELIREAKTLGLKHLYLHASEDGLRIYRKAGFANSKQTELELTLE